MDARAMMWPAHLLKPMHMVQNQMTPSYPQFTQTGIEEYQGLQQAAGAGLPPVQGAPTVTVTDPQTQTQQTVTVSTTNGVEQQTINSKVEPVQLVEMVGDPVYQRRKYSEQTDLENEAASSQAAAAASLNTGPKRLHVSNIPFRFREADLRNLLGGAVVDNENDPDGPKIQNTAFGPILDVEIIFNERGSKGFGFVTFANSADADRAREKLNGTVVEGRKIEVNNATARIMTKKANPANVANVAALRGAALARGVRVRGVYPPAAGAMAQAQLSQLQQFRHPAQLAQPATGLPYSPAGLAGYQDPFGLTAYAAERYQVGQPYAAGYAAAATRYAVPTIATAATYAAATGGAVLSSYGREYAAEPYLAGHTIGPVPGYGAAVYRGGGYQRFAPY